MPDARAVPLTPELRPTVLHLRSSGGLFGADRVVLDLCLALGAHGYRALLAPLTEPGTDARALRERAAALGVPVRPLVLGSRFDLGALGRLKRLVAIEGAVVLHTHDYKSSTLAALAGPAGDGARRHAPWAGGHRLEAPALRVARSPARPPLRPRDLCFASRFAPPRAVRASSRW